MMTFMRAPLLVALVLATVVLAVRPSTAVTLADCERWMNALGGEVADAPIGGDEATKHRAALMDDVDAARRGTREAGVEESRKRVQRIEKKTADLTAHGQLSRVEGQRLGTLSEATRRCLDQVNAQ